MPEKKLWFNYQLPLKA